jgi:hypothetical protein
MIIYREKGVQGNSKPIVSFTETAAASKVCKLSGYQSLRILHELQKITTLDCLPV